MRKLFITFISYLNITKSSVHLIGQEVRTVEERKYVPKDKIKEIATEVLEALKKYELPMWQVKEVLKTAGEQTEWETLK